MKIGIELVLLTVKRHFESFLNHYLYLKVERNCICPCKRRVVLSHIYSLYLVVNKTREMYLTDD